MLADVAFHPETDIAAVRGSSEMAGSATGPAYCGKGKTGCIIERRSTASLVSLAAGFRGGWRVSITAFVFDGRFGGWVCAVVAVARALKDNKAEHRLLSTEAHSPVYNPTNSEMFFEADLTMLQQLLVMTILLCWI